MAEVVEPDAIIDPTPCGVIMEHIPVKGDIVFCATQASELIALNIGDENIYLPVCQHHYDGLENNKEYVIKERDGDRKFAIQFGRTSDTEPPSDASTGT